MAPHSTLNWRAALWPLVLVSGMATAFSAHATREITSSDSGNGGGLGTAGVNRLFNCTDRNIPSNPDVPFSCVGALSHSYNANTNFGTVEGLVNGRFNNWTYTDQSSVVDFISPVGKIFFSNELHGNFAIVLSGTWLNTAQITNAPQRSGWSSYYLLEDVDILPHTTLDPARSIRLNLEGVDPGPNYYSTNDLILDTVSVYQINAVPEPGGLPLVALALASLALLRRRRG